MNRRNLLAAAAAFLSTTHAFAQHGSSPPHAAAATAPRSATFTKGTITVETPWTRATPSGARVAGGFMVIRNTGTEPDRLVGGSFPGAPRVEVHEMAVVEGTMRMRALRDGIAIPPGGSMQLRPGSYHMMFMDLSRPVAAGAPVKATLVFERAGTVEIEYDVAPVGAPGPAGHGGGHGHGTPRH